MTNKVRMIVRVQPTREDAIQMASQGLAAGKLSGKDAQAVERCVQGSGIIAADLLHRVKQSVK
ncbi:hypothetical protein [Paraburkholderia sediminicola]|uniref:hypothetical protein n=1 Tax=Paraburkholderia sediminicola TaxID=458836 RepID=UPI0038BA30B4